MHFKVLVEVRSLCEIVTTVWYWTNVGPFSGVNSQVIEKVVPLIKRLTAPVKGAPKLLDVALADRAFEKEVDELVGLGHFGKLDALGNAEFLEILTWDHFDNHTLKLLIFVLILAASSFCSGLFQSLAVLCENSPLSLDDLERKIKRIFRYQRLYGVPNKKRGRLLLLIRDF